MLTLDNFQTLLRKVQQAQREHDQDVGALDLLLHQLKEDFKVVTPTAGEQLLKKLQGTRTKTYNEYVEKKKAFEERHAEALQ